MNEDVAAHLHHDLVEELCRPPVVVDAGTMLRAASKRPTFVVPEMIPAADLTLITGAPGSLKSWLAYDLVRAVAKCGTWMGQPITIPEKRNGYPFGCAAVVFNYDNPRAECGRRFLRLGLDEHDPVFFHSLDVGAPLRLPESAEHLTAVVDYFRPRLVVIDSLRQAHTSEENSSKEMMAVMGTLKRLYACGAAVVVVHHASKALDGSSHARGSGEIDASSTVAIHVSLDRGLHRAEWYKHRSWPMSPEQEKKWFRVVDEGDITKVLPAAKPEKRDPKG